MWKTRKTARGRQKSHSATAFRSGILHTAWTFPLLMHIRPLRQVIAAITTLSLLCPTLAQAATKVYFSNNDFSTGIHIFNTATLQAAGTINFGTNSSRMATSGTGLYIAVPNL